MAKYLARNNLSKGRVYFNSVGQDTVQHRGKARWPEREAAGGSQETESGKEVARGCRTSRPVLRDVLPLWRLHFLKILQFSQTTPLSSDQVFKHLSLSGTLQIQIPRRKPALPSFPLPADGEHSGGIHSHSEF